MKVDAMYFVVVTNHFKLSPSDSVRYTSTEFDGFHHLGAPLSPQWQSSRLVAAEALRDSHPERHPLGNDGSSSTGSGTSPKLH